MRKFESLESLAAYLNLPQGLLKRLADEHRIPYVSIDVFCDDVDKKGRRYFDAEEVHARINKIARVRRAKKRKLLIQFEEGIDALDVTQAFSFSPRVRKALRRLNIKTVKQLRDTKAVELIGLKNFGMTSLNEVIYELGERGMSLADADPGRVI